MKKTACIALAILLIFTFISCNGAKDVEEQANGEMTVYVSKYGKIHSDPSCSGMVRYETMTLSEAIDEGYVVCKKCSADIQKALDGGRD